MIVTEHRPPLKRIDNSRPARPAEAPTIDLNCIAAFQEQERIWKLLRQSAEGCNSVAEEVAQ
jgi:hypothetical protein